MKYCHPHFSRACSCNGASSHSCQPTTEADWSWSRQEHHTMKTMFSMMAHVLHGPSRPVMENLQHECQRWYTRTFWMTHQHSPIINNNYSQKHAWFSHDFQKLQRLHENGVCCYMASEPPKIMWEWGTLSCGFQRLQRLGKSILQSFFKNKGLMQLRATLSCMRPLFLEYLELHEAFILLIAGACQHKNIVWS